MSTWQSDVAHLGDPDLEAFLGTLAVAGTRELPNAVTVAHLEAMLAAQPAPVAASTWGTRLRRLGALVTAKTLLLGIASAAAATGGLAAAGVLPDAVQAVVHDAGALVGITLPDSASDTAQAHVPDGSGPGERVDGPAGRSGEVPAVADERRSEAAERASEARDKAQTPTPPEPAAPANQATADGRGGSNPGSSGSSADAVGQDDDAIEDADSSDDGDGDESSDDGDDGDNDGDESSDEDRSGPTEESLSADSDSTASKDRGSSKRGD